MAGRSGGSSVPKKRPPAKSSGQHPTTKLNSRQKAVVKTAAKNVADANGLNQKGRQAFKQGLRSSLKSGGARKNDYVRTAVKAARVETTPKEAAGVRRVLNRVGTSTTHSKTGLGGDMHAPRAKKGYKMGVLKKTKAL